MERLESRMDSEFTAIRAEMGSELRAVRAEMNSGLGEVRGEIGELRAQMSTQFRWTLAFIMGMWVTVIVAILFK